MKRRAVDREPKPVETILPKPAGGIKLESFVPLTLVKKPIRKEVVLPPGAVPLAKRQPSASAAVDLESPGLRALGLAFHWQCLLDAGTYPSMTAIALAEGVQLSQVSRLASLAHLAPDIVEACLAQPMRKWSLERLIRCAGLPEWTAQRQYLGLAQD